MSALMQHGLLMAAGGSAPAPWAPGDWRLPGVAHTWWIRPVSARYGPAYYIGGITPAGEIKVFKVAPTGVASFTLHSGARGDDHNAPSITQLPDGRLLAFYTRHGLDSQLRYRISTSPDDISAWGAEQSIATAGGVTYSQAWVDSTGRVHVFHRITTLTWAHRYSDNNAATWSAGKTFISTGNRPYIATVPAPDSPDTLRLAVAGHPIDSPDHNIYYGEINLISGDIRAPGGPSLVNLYDATPAIAPAALEVAYTAPANSRMLDIGSGTSPQILLASFSGVSDAQYREARRVSETWEISAPIADAGPPIENPVGANYYFAGMAATADQDEIYTCRRDALTANWVIEKWTRDGSGWTLSGTVHNEDWRTYSEVFRPMAPANAGVNIPLTFLRGEYSGYGNAINHLEHFTDIVFDPAQVPAFSGTVLYQQSFAGLAASAPVPGWEVLVKSGTVTDETFTAEDEVKYYGGTYGQMYHRNGLATLWGVAASSALNTRMRADMRFVQGSAGVVGLVNRWVDSNNRIEIELSYAHGLFRVVERVAGVSHTTSVPLPSSLTPGDSFTIESEAVGSSITGRLYQNGVMVAEVTASLVGPQVAGKFGLKVSSHTEVSTTVAETQRVLVVAL